MAKRFAATELWAEDWFLDMPNEYKLFWFYILAHCDHAGIFRVNLRSFQNLLGIKVSEVKALEFINFEKERITVVSKSTWFIEDFFVFQYGDILNFNNKLHESVEKIHKRYNINTLSLRGLKEVKERTNRPPRVDLNTLKDKDKVKDKDKEDVILSKDILKENEFVCYDAEEYLLSNRIQFEKICMATGKKEDVVNKELHMYHLWLSKNEKYPMGKKAALAGIESWIHNSKGFKKAYNQEIAPETGIVKKSAQDILNEYGYGK